MIDGNTRLRNLIDEKHRLGFFFLYLWKKPNDFDFDFDFRDPGGGERRVRRQTRDAR